MSILSDLIKSAILALIIFMFLTGDVRAGRVPLFDLRLPDPPPSKRRMTVEAYLLEVAREKNLNLVIGPGREMCDIRHLRAAYPNIPDMARAIRGAYARIGKIDVIYFPSRREPFHEKVTFDYLPTPFENGTVKADAHLEDARSIVDDIAKKLRFRVAFSRRASGEISLHVVHVDAIELFRAIARALNVNLVEIEKGSYEFR